MGTIERLERALALFLVVAWRVAYLMRLGRTCPDLDAHLFFDPDEIRSAYLLTKTQAPAQPKLDEVLRLIARLRGFLGRKGDGEPGAKTIWLGLKEIHVAAKTLSLLRDDDGDDTLYKRMGDAGGRETENSSSVSATCATCGSDLGANQLAVTLFWRPT